MLKKFDDIINSVTMYRLVLYSLTWLAGVALLLSAAGILNQPLVGLLLTLAILTVVCGGVKFLLVWLTRLPANHESGLITTLILFFIMTPTSSPEEAVGVAIAGLVAMVSKYVLIWRGANIFNPAAVGAFVAVLTGTGFASWWVATPVLLPFVVLIGFLILKKTRRFELFAAFAIPAIVLTALRGISIETLLFSFPLVFLGTVMLTEPGTQPGTRKLRLIYGALIGLLFGSQLTVGPVELSQQGALLIGNLFALCVSFRASTKMTLVKKVSISPTTFELTFKPDRKLKFQAGQYLEWTLSSVKLDARGNRRTFTVASSPTSDNLTLGVKQYQPGSQFKQTLFSLQPGDTIAAAHPGGDFTLPIDKSRKLVFIAGGIGVTPFKAMVDYLVDTNQKRDIVLFYFASSDDEILFQDVFQRAGRYGLKLIPITQPDVRLDEAMLKRYVKDYSRRDFYLSGPPGMVNSYKQSLKKLGISSSHIHTDYFAGY